MLNEDVSFDYWKKKNIEYVEKFINGSGFNAVQEFSKTHDVDSEAVKEFIHQLATLTYAPHNETIQSYYDNLNHLGMKYLEAFVCVLSVITTVGKLL